MSLIIESPAIRLSGFDSFPLLSLATCSPAAIICSVVRFAHVFVAVSLCCFCLATITLCDLSATILFKLVHSYLIAFKFAQ